MIDRDIALAKVAIIYRKLSLDVLKAILVHHLTDLETFYSEVLALLPPSLPERPVD
ncbi:MAG: hypothetical protein RMJ55_14730 [Roseiflexaceae bacterium]|nr:hypothetical protein [Roseiflexus sp.]MDW8214810.1 hypothetical protein [Roseiflexaceae bacterium]